jgi:hypothetical protein
MKVITVRLIGELKVHALHAAKCNFKGCWLKKALIVPFPGEDDIVRHVSLER